MSEGTIVRIVGPVVDVDFSEAKKVPKIYDALEIESEGGNEQPSSLVLEVQQDLGRRLGPRNRDVDPPKA